MSFLSISVEKKNHHEDLNCEENKVKVEDEHVEGHHVVRFPRFRVLNKQASDQPQALDQNCRLYVLQE